MKKVCGAERTGSSSKCFDENLSMIFITPEETQLVLIHAQDIASQYHGYMALLQFSRSEDFPPRVF